MFLPWMSEIDGENWCLRRCRSASSRKEIKVEPSPLYRSLSFLKADDLFSLILYRRVAFVASLVRISWSKDFGHSVLFVSYSVQRVAWVGLRLNMNVVSVEVEGNLVVKLSSSVRFCLFSHFGSEVAKKQLCFSRIGKFGLVTY